MILFFSINLISANEINDSNINSIDSSDLNGIDSAENTKIASADLNQNQNADENLNSDINQNDQSSETLSEDASASPTDSATLKSSADSTETLRDSENSENQMDNTLNLSDGNGNSSELSSANVSSTKTLSKKTAFTVSKTSIHRGSSIKLYLKDSEGNPMVGKKISYTINNIEYTKTTDKNGAVAIKFNQLLGKYTLKAYFSGDSEYAAKTSSFSLNIYKLKTQVTSLKTSVYRGKYLYVYLKDRSGNALSNQKISISIVGKKHTLTTNKKGRVSLRISSAVGRYPVKINYYGSVGYYKSSESFTLKVCKQPTKIVVANATVIRGKCLYAYLKTSSGDVLKNQAVTIRFNNINFYRTTNSKGKVGLQIKTKIGTFQTKIIYNGNNYYKASYRNINLKSYVAKTKISSASSVVRGKYYYIYLKDSYNKPAAGENLKINFSGKQYTKTTDSKGKVALKISAKVDTYSVSIKHDLSNSYRSSSKTLKLNVLTNATAKIVANNQTSLGEYSIRLTDLKNNPLSNQTLKVITSTYGKVAGSMDKITQKTIVIDSDNIYNKDTDKKYMNSLASALRAKGYKVIVSDIGPNSHCDDVMGKYSNAVILCLFGGADSGMFKDMSSSWYQNYLKKYNNRVVLGFLEPVNTVNLANCTWLKRAHDDDYSPDSFTGLSNPGAYLNEHGMDYIYGGSAVEMANNFVNYAVKGLSIGMNNMIPCKIDSYSLKTNENGYATLSNLPSGTYTVQISYSNTALGYVADTVKTKVKIL